jgi:hypothetical protein
MRILLCAALFADVLWSQSSNPTFLEKGSAYPVRPS